MEETVTGAAGREELLATATMGSVEVERLGEESVKSVEGAQLAAVATEAVVMAPEAPA